MALLTKVHGDLTNGFDALTGHVNPGLRELPGRRVDMRASFH